MSTQAWGAAGSEATPLDVSCDLDATPAREVRRLVRELLGGGDGVLVDDAVLVADELVSNAHQHATAPRACRLALLDGGRRLRIEVDDASPEPPRIRTPDRTGGRGLVLVARLASAWGVRHDRDHKTVWAVLSVDGSGGHRRHLATATPEADRTGHGRTGHGAPAPAEDG